MEMVNVQKNSFFQKMKKGSLYQFVLYACIGGVNVALDFAVMNLLWHFSGRYSGNINYLFKSISFIAYSTNGYFLNKKLTFNAEGNSSSYLKYMSVLGAAMIANAFILSNLTMYNLLDTSPALWANICQLIASMTTGIASFLANKFFVFTKKKAPTR